MGRGGGGEGGRRPPKACWRPRAAVSGPLPVVPGLRPGPGGQGRAGPGAGRGADWRAQLLAAVR